MKRLAYIALAIVAFAGTLPVLYIIWADRFAEKHGCVVSGAGIRPCIVDGTDWGATLGVAVLVGWLALVTLPITAIALAAILIIFTFSLIRKRLAGKP